MKVEIWFDFICPFSYRGFRNFNKALDLFVNKKDVEVFFHSYNITPNINKKLDIDVYEHLAQHKDISYGEAKDIYKRLSVLAKKEGVIADFENLIPTTSVKAHNILKMIDDDCAKKTFINYVFSAHFVEGKDISALDVLTEIGQNVSLNKEDIKVVFDTEMYEHDIHNDYLKAENYGLTGVPAFVIDESYYLMGGHSIEAYLEMLDTFYQKSKKNDIDIVKLFEGKRC